MDWDLTTYFDSFEGPGFRVFRETLGRDTQALRMTLAEAPGIGAETFGFWAEQIGDWENLLRRYSHVGSYLGCLVSADAANRDYSAAEAAFSEQRAELSKATQLLERALGEAKEEAFKALLAYPGLEDAAFPLEWMRDEARRRMSKEEEALAADLAVNGRQAWSRLYFQLGGTLKFTLAVPGEEPREVPMAQRMSLLCQPERAVRRAAFEGSAQVWGAHAQTAAAALNAMAGERLTLFKRRGIGHFLEEAARAGRVQPATLEALLTAIEGKRAFAQSILKHRLAVLGIEDGAFYDLHAPLSGGEGETLDWTHGAQLVEDSFRSAYPALGAFMREMLDKRWIDYNPRESKRPGGFCTSSSLSRESRIFMTYRGTMNEIMTLAHEAGHAWHNRVLAVKRALANSYPMTLAESASTFAEMILSEGVLQSDRFTAAQKLQILDSDAERALAFLLDIPVRYRFEEAFYVERAKGVLSPERISEIMTEKQRASFGDALAPGGEDPLFWCSKLHFYIDGTFFYNYPYSFGYLLSLSLFARFKAEGASFLPAYEAMLRDTGSMDCETVIAHHFGEDIGEPAFWERAIDSLGGTFEQLKALTGG